MAERTTNPYATSDWNTLVEVSPAYGRDYNNQAEVMKDWMEDLDFVVESVTCPWVGMNTSRSNCIDLDVKQVMVRYGGGTKQLMVVPGREKRARQQR